MVDLLNEFSDRNDIVFVWGHNHRTDSNRHKFYDRNDLLLIGPGEYKRVKFSYINAGCLNEGHSEQDYGPEGTKYGPGYCLETRILDGKIVLDYAHVYGAYPDPAQAKFDHNADLLYVDTLPEARESPHEIALLHTGACAHDYAKTHVDPTCAEWGRDVYTCSRCGLRYEEIVDGRDEPLGHIWDAAAAPKPSACAASAPPCTTTWTSPPPMTPANMRSSRRSSPPWPSAPACR